MERLDSRRSLVVGALLAALLSAVALGLVTRIWSQPLHVPFQYAHVAGDDEQDATLDMMLIKNVHETGWFDENPKLNAPFRQRWAEWPMGGDLLAYTIKKGIVDATGEVALTFNLFWLLTFPLTALVAFPVLRSLRCSWSTALAGAVLFALAPYHFRNGAGHENLAFYVGVPIIVLLCMRVLGPDGGVPSVAELRHRAGWRPLLWPLLGTVLVAVTGLYYLAFLLTLLTFSAVIGALARRRPGRLAIAGIVAAVGLVASILANLPTLLYRWQHAPNILGVPDRRLGISEDYPLRLVELLSPVSGHRFGPFAALADLLLDPGRKGLGTAMLGLAAAIGVVVAIIAVLLGAVRDRARDSWSFEARVGIVIVGALLLGMQGGLSRALELVGLSGVRAWTRIAIVVAFAGIVVFARLLDRARADLARRRHVLQPAVWGLILAVVVVVGVLDQASPAMLPKPAARADLWNADGAFVDTLERRLPANAMVFQLPVVDFPEHGGIRRMSDHDLIKESYLHSKTLRWSAGGVRGRDGEWQWPAAQLPTHAFLRGITAMGFSALMVDRYGYPDDGNAILARLRKVLGPPMVRREDRLVAWDLRPGAPALLAGTNATQRNTLVRKLLDAPRLYLGTDVDPIVDRGESHVICADGSLTLVNPGPHHARRDLKVTFATGRSAARRAWVTVGGRRVPISPEAPARVPIDLRPGTTTVPITVHTPGLRCASAPVNALPSVSAEIRPVRLPRA